MERYIYCKDVCVGRIGSNTWRDILWSILYGDITNNSFQTSALAETIYDSRSNAEFAARLIYFNVGFD
jgi:hypothetical protein